MLAAPRASRFAARKPHSFDTSFSIWPVVNARIGRRPSLHTEQREALYNGIRSTRGGRTCIHFYLSSCGSCIIFDKITFFLEIYSVYIRFFPVTRLMLVFRPFGRFSFRLNT